MATSLDTVESKKRTSDKITPGSFDDEADITNIYQKLCEQRKKINVKVENVPTDTAQQEKDNKMINLKQEIKANVKIEHDVPIKEEAKDPPVRKFDRKWLYISKLLFYRKDQYRDCMITFKEMMFEDLCKNPNNFKTTLEAAFMTTYNFELELLEPLLKANVWLVLGNDLNLDSGLKAVERRFKGYPNLTLIHPTKVNSSGKAGVFHPKLWLLKFPSTLRVVVTSGNLYTGAFSVWSNCIWFQDFPQKALKEEFFKEEVCKEEFSAEFDFNKDFKATLENFIQGIMPSNYNYKSLLKIDLNDYIYENIDVILVPSLTGRYQGHAMKKYGIGKLKYILDKFPCQIVKEDNKKVINYQITSIGQVSKKFIWEFAASALPGYQSVEESRKIRKNEKKMIKDPSQKTLFSEKESGWLSVKDRVRLIFPTAKHVEACGIEAGCSLFLGKAYWESGRLPRQILYQFDPPGIIPHSKIFVITDDDNEVNDDTMIYFGSHNFSSYAWGKYEKALNQLSIINTELGVLIPPMKGTAERKKDLVENLNFKVPPKKYSANDEPFIQEKYQYLHSSEIAVDLFV